MPNLASDLIRAFSMIATETVDLATAETLIQENEADDRVYLLVSGCLQVSHSISGTSATIAQIDEPGSLVGEMVALGGGKRTATVTALQPSRVLATSETEFQKILADQPDLARSLLAAAVRRSEERELAGILARHFGIREDGALKRACASVEWMHIRQGEVLVTEGEESDSMFFVVKGRFSATRRDPYHDVEFEIGRAGRGEAVGEIGLLSRKPRMATVRAIRDSVVARMDADVFELMIEAEPRMAVHLGVKAMERAEDSRWRPSTATVLSVVVAPNVDGDLIASAIAAELARHGSTARLSREIVEAMLDSPGISDSRPDGLGDIRVSRVVHETELGSDHLVVEVGAHPGPWARRALGMSDRVLIATPADPSRELLGHLDSMLGGCPSGVTRTLVVVHDGPDVKPSETSTLAVRLGAHDAVHVTTRRSDLARLGRLATGRANTLVLGGGGGRGFAHIGVYRALDDLGFPVDLVGGTSIGGVIAAVIADGQSPDEILQWAQAHFPTALDYTLPLVSLTKGKRIASSAASTFGEREIEDLWLSYFAMSADLTASRAHVHDRGSVVVAIRATSAIPGVMPPVPFGDALLVDGGVLNNLPLDVARTRSPHGRLIAVDVAPPRGPGAHGDYGLSVSGWAALRSKFGAHKGSYPGISAVLMRSMITASMRERDNMVQSGLADCYLDLDMRGVSMLDFDDASGVASRGYDAAIPKLERWLEGPPSDPDR